jgi:hypothetical protein
LSLSLLLGASQGNTDAIQLHQMALQALESIQLNKVILEKKKDDAGCLSVVLQIVLVYGSITTMMIAIAYYNGAFSGK